MMTTRYQDRRCSPNLGERSVNFNVLAELSWVASQPRSGILGAKRYGVWLADQEGSTCADTASRLGGASGRCAAAASCCLPTPTT